MSVFVPYTQRKAHVELKPGDFVRIQSDFFIIDEVRKFRRPYPDAITFYTANQAALNLPELTGSLKSRFQHIDKFAIDAVDATTTVVITYRNTDITGLQFAHVWTTLNAGVASPNEIGINSFSREDLFTLTLTIGAVETAVRLWFSGEEYTLVAFPDNGGPGGDGIPARFVVIAPYGWSRVVSKEEFETSEMAQRLRT